MLPPKPAVVPDSQETRARWCTAITTGRNITSSASPDRSATSTGRRSRGLFAASLSAPVFPLYPAPGVAADGYAPGRSTFDQACELEIPPAPISAAAIGDVLRHALGLSAWKVFKASRWALRVNPSSGNLHPTEAYVVCGAVAGLAGRPAVYHYAPDRHALELRCAFDDDGVAERRRGTRRRGAGRAHVDSLARSVEIRRARVPLLPARPRPRHRGRVHRRRPRRMARRAAARLVAACDCRGHGHRPRRGLRRSGARRTRPASWR